MIWKKKNNKWRIGWKKPTILTEMIITNTGPNKIIQLLLLDLSGSLSKNHQSMAEGNS